MDSLVSRLVQIKLSQGQEATIDDADSALVAGYNWKAKKDTRTWYAVADRGGKRVRMHRVIAGLTDPKVKLDHRDRNGLNNRRGNLRTATQSQNMANTDRLKNNTSGFKGVWFDKRKRRWRVQIYCQNVRHSLGRFKDKEEAARTYDRAAIRLFGEYARLNYPT